MGDYVILIWFLYFGIHLFPIDRNMCRTERIENYFRKKM